MQVYDPPLNVQGAPPSPVPSIGQGKPDEDRGSCGHLSVCLSYLFISPKTVTACWLEN